jgi:hypothetical protein
MTDSWNELVALSLTEMEQKQKALPPSDPAGQWHADQDSGTFTMTDSRGNVIVKARLQLVGTYSTMSQSWLWSWANRSIDFANRSALEEVRELGHKHGWRRLTDERVPCSEQEAIHLWAVAVHAMRAPAWYRIQLSPTSITYLALFELHTGSVGFSPAHQQDFTEATGLDEQWKHCPSWSPADPWQALIIKTVDVPFGTREYLESWKWLLKDSFEPVLITAFGDWFLRDREGRIYRLAVGWGQAAVVANTLAEFQQARLAPENLGSWFMPALVAELRKTGSMLGRHEELAEPFCYSYVIPPFLGGRFEPKNIRMLPLSVHTFLWGSVFQQVKDLPPGTRVRKIEMDSEGKVEVDFLEPSP